MADARPVIVFSDRRTDFVVELWRVLNSESVVHQFLRVEDLTDVLRRLNRAESDHSDLLTNALFIIVVDSGQFDVPAWVRGPELALMWSAKPGAAIVVRTTDQRPFIDVYEDGGLPLLTQKGVFIDGFRKGIEKGSWRPIQPPPSINPLEPSASADPFGDDFDAVDGFERVEVLVPAAIPRQAPRGEIDSDAVLASPTTTPSGPKGGSILWTMPERMKVARRERVEVRIGDAAVAEDQLREALKGRGTPKIDTLEIAPTMRVSLVCDDRDFSVKPLSSADQLLREAKVARWDFDVVPLRGGHRLLRVLVTMRVKLEGKDELIDLPSYEREVSVAVAPLHSTGRFVANNWQYCAGAAAAGIGLALWHTEAGITVGKAFGLVK